MFPLGLQSWSGAPCLTNLFSDYKCQPPIKLVGGGGYLLFVSPQIKAEFKRVVSTDLLKSFLDGLDGLVPRLLEVYEAATKSGKKQALKDILDCLKKEVSGGADDHESGTLSYVC